MNSLELTMLKRLQSMLEPRTRSEAVRYVVIYTAFALIVSFAVDYLFILAVGSGPISMLTTALVIPLLLAPPMTAISAKTMLRMNEMRSELERLVSVDPLTGALNRRGLHDFAERCFNQARPQHALSAIIFDVDRFKSINDTYGHAAGDMVIAQVARLIKENAETENFVVGRLGGDELIAYFTSAHLEETMITAERLRDRIENTIFIHDNRCIPVTCSIGVAAAATGETNIEPMLKRADQALYAAKTAGRNRVRAAA